MNKASVDVEPETAESEAGSSGAVRSGSELLARRHAVATNGEAAMTGADATKSRPTDRESPTGDGNRAAAQSRAAPGGLGQTPELHVLAGRQAGARIELESGATLLGSARHCEIVLRDDGVDPEHVLFSLGDGRATVRVLGSPIQIDGRRVTDGQAALKAGAVLQIGKARVGIAPADFDWQAVEIAAAGPSEAEGGVKPEGQAARLRSRVKERPGAALLLGMAVLGLAALLAVATAGGFSKALPSQAQRIDLARDSLSRLGLAEVYAEPQPDGRISIVGYVPDLSAMRRLRQAFADEDVVIKAYAASELTRFASEWLNSRNLKAQVNYLGNGALEVVGQDVAGRRLSSAAEQLAQEVSGVSSVRQRIAPAVVAEAPKPAPAEPEPYVLGGINGVNAGHPVPYISSGQSYIFSGGALKNGMTVMAIEPERVVVDDHGRRLASEIQVR